MAEYEVVSSDFGAEQDHQYQNGAGNGFPGYAPGMRQPSGQPSGRYAEAHRGKNLQHGRKG